MKMTNKLTLHHKSKFGLVMRNLSIAAGSFCFALAAFVLPTYISIVGERNVATLAEETQNEHELKQDQEQETVEEEELLTYEEE